MIFPMDASSYTIEAVLLQDGRAIPYSSEALTMSQQHYPEIKKEALAICDGFEKFNDYN